MADADDTTIDPQIVAAARGANLVGAPTTDADDIWSWPRRPAVALAREIGARLVLATCRPARCGRRRTGPAA